MATRVAEVTEMPLARYTRWALALTVAAMPLYVVRWRVGPIPTTLLENLILLTVALYLFAIWRQRGPLPGRTPYDIAIALFFLAGIIGSFVAPDHRGALGIFRAFLVEPIAIYYVAVAVLTTTAAIELLLVAWSVGSVLFAIVGVITLIQVLVTGRLDADSGPGTLGINPNAVAMYLEPLIGLATGMVLMAKGTHRWVAAGTLLLLIPAELATLSRGGLVALAVLACLAVYSTRERGLRIALAATALAGGVVLWFVPVIGPRLDRAFAPVWGSVFGRGRVWQASLHMLVERPVFGAGLNNYQSAMAPFRAADPYLRLEPHPHNLLLTTWSQLGLLGLFAIMYILGGLIVRPWRALGHASGFNRALLWGLGASFVMIAVHGLVDSTYWKNDLSLEFWVFAALEVVAIRSVRVASTPVG